MEVHGIGDVELEVRADAGQRSGEYNRFRLFNVLYAPGSIANIVSKSSISGVVKGYNIEHQSPALFDDEGGRVFMLDRLRLHKLWLVGQPRGHTSLKVQDEDTVGADWSQTERSRWESFQFSQPSALPAEPSFVRGPVLASPPDSTQSTKPSPAAAEQQSKSRKKRRRPMRREKRIMKAKKKRAVLKEAGGITKSVQNGVSRPSWIGYSDAGKFWLKRHYGNEFKFLRQYGLKIYDRDDREEGQRMVRSFMEDDDWAQA